MTTISLRRHQFAVQAPVRLRSLLRQQLGLWYARARQRAQLAQLSDQQLVDIGISRSEALKEAAKPFWQA